MGITLVTGGAGFIGSHLVESLATAGQSVRVLDNFSTGQTSNLAGCRDHVDLVRGDVRDKRAVAKAVKGVSLVYHLAAVSSVPLSVAEPEPTFAANLEGTWTLLEACRQFGVKRFVFTSSASVYGPDCPLPFKEDMRLRANSPYAVSKLIGEELCDLYTRLYGLESVCLRLFSVVGPRQNPRSQYANVVPNFSRRLLAGERPVIYGDGLQTRDFVFVGDVVRAFRQAGRRRSVAGQIINFGSGRQTSVLELARLMQQALHADKAVDFEPKRAGDDPHTLADISKARKLLGISKLTPLGVALKRTLQWYARTL